jgi:rod shape-determining protein MreC
MNVIAGSGLVGIVIDAGPNYSKVKSIIDDTSNVSAMITNTGNNFIVSGNLKTVNESMVISFSELKDSDNEVKAGDQVVTSYVSDLYHQGILIGYISTIEDSPNNLTKMGTITPVVDFEHLEEVFVITKLKETGESGD